MEKAFSVEKSALKALSHEYVAIDSLPTALTAGA